jgi:putative membrane protein
MDGSINPLQHMRVWRGVIAGLVGGVIAAGAMSLVHKGLGRQPNPPAQQQDDATVKVADGISRWLLDRPIPEGSKPLAANVVHYAFGASVGALYGGVAELVPRISMVVGVPFGLAVWLGAHVITVPALGLAEPPTRQPRDKEGLELLLHAVYGAVTETVRRLVRRAL